MGDGYEAMRSSAGALVTERDVVAVDGPDAAAFLQGQLSQDVLCLVDGSSCLAWVLQPVGKVEALVRVHRIGDEHYLLDTDAGFADSLVARLNRFKLRTKVEIAKLAWVRLAVRGPRFGEVAVPAGSVALDASWPGLPGVDFLGEDLAVPAGVEQVSAAELEAARIEAGVPVMGKELDERTIPAETGLVDRTVSFTKGCYTGQELVARIDSRGGNVPRRLTGFLLSAQLEPPSVLVRSPGAKTAATLTSVALSPRLGWVGLGYASRATEAGASLVVAARGAAGEAGSPDTGSDITATVAAVPLVR